MVNYAQAEQRLTDALGLARRPVAIAFRDTPPSGVAKFEGTQPSSCSFWRLAADGRSFYTVPADHYNCPVGSYTHNIPLPPDREPELMQTLSLMSDIGYIRMEEVPGVPRLPQTPAALVYAPLGDTVADPDVVLDLADYFERLAPENDPRYRHTIEGPDDMPGHIRAALTQTSLSIPVMAGRMALGTWQGIYLFEHRAGWARRSVVLHLAT